MDREGLNRANKNSSIKEECFAFKWGRLLVAQSSYTCSHICKGTRVFHASHSQVTYFAKGQKSVISVYLIAASESNNDY